jgi:dihydrofolate synthase/folylpolyglutamate synthase
MDTTAATLAWLTNLRAGGSRLGIDRMRALVDRLGLGSVLSTRPTFHVAGTNGKGSTCAMIEAIQARAGRVTGLYTSPHLVRLGERVRRNGVEMAESELVAAAAAIRPVAEAIARETPGLAPTFFELITALALRECLEVRPVDVLILETGLGGRLDATTVCSPLVTVITSIGLDHQEYLGDTLEAIAAEKAGILKPGVPCALGILPAAAESVIRARAKALGVTVHAVRERFGDDLPTTNLEGAHQRINAACALLACELAAPQLPFDPSAARAALCEVRWEARWQRIPLADGRTLVVDASHNEEGARALEPLLAKLVRPTVIVGATGASRAGPLLAVVARHAAEIYLVEANNERALKADALAALLPPGFSGKVHRSCVADLFPGRDTCVAAGECVVVVGSLYLAGEVLGRLRGETPSVNWQDRLPPAR